MDEAFRGLQQLVHDERTSWSLGSMMGLCALPVQTCMRNKQEAKGLCTLEANEFEPSFELLSCDDYCITYNTQAFAWNIFTLLQLSVQFHFHLKEMFVSFVSIATETSLFLIQPGSFLSCLLFFS